MVFESLDGLYDSAPDFDTLYETIAAKILEVAEQGDAAYAVPGHPLIAEESVRLILDRARSRGIPFRIIGSESFLEPALVLLGRSIGNGILLRDALSMDTWTPLLDTPLLLYQVYDPQTASDVKLRLMERYPAEHPVTVITAAGLDGSESAETLPLHLLDRARVNHLTSVYVPPIDAERRPKTFEDLVGVMARLRAPGGCPWDREQDHLTLKRYLIEETYEVIDAIDSGDMAELAEELGDLLLQVVFHAQLGAGWDSQTSARIIARGETD